MFNFKKGLFSKKLMFAIPLLGLHFYASTKNRERHSIIFLEKNYFKQTNSQRVGLLMNSHWKSYFLMILPQVHLRKPCYDFYFL